MLDFGERIRTTGRLPSGVRRMHPDPYPERGSVDDQSSHGCPTVTKRRDAEGWRSMSKPVNPSQKKDLLTSLAKLCTAPELHI